MSETYTKTEYGWNIKYKRPATREELIHKSWEVCHCCECSPKGGYGHFYCGRIKAHGYITNMERRYWELRETLSEQKVVEEEVRRRKIDRDRNRSRVQRYAGND